MAAAINFLRPRIIWFPPGVDGCHDPIPARKQATGADHGRLSGGARM